MELLLPNWIQVPKNGLGTLLGFTHLHSHVRVTGSCLVLGLQALSTHHCNPNTQRRRQSMLQKSEILQSMTHTFSILEKPLSASCTETPPDLPLVPSHQPFLQSLIQESQLPIKTLTDHLPLNSSLPPLIDASFSHIYPANIINHWLTIS